MQSLDGILIIDKPKGITSHDVVSRVRRILKTRRVGHAGTLDPFATGVLVVCVNRATRLVKFLTCDDKEYLATMRLGFATDTGDLTGSPLSEAASLQGLTIEIIREALVHFRGQIEQVPPMYSAKKISGMKLYELARRGLEVERQPISVEIKQLELYEPLSRSIESHNQELIQDVSFRVVCSSGTYIRTLAEDIGSHLGVGAHLIELRRTRSGFCNLDHAVTLIGLGELAEAGKLAQVMIPMAEPIALDELRLSEDERKAVVHGHSISRDGEWLNAQQAKLCDARGELIAIAEYNLERKVWQPRVVLSEA